MSLPEAAVQEASPSAAGHRVVNDFSIQVATVNGSGSQTANLVLLRSIFQMGVPVSGKNLFPSNIAGLPTWYTIRANKDGYIARKKEIDFLVAMNPETAREDVLSLGPGAAVVYDEPLGLKTLRSDLVFYPVPFDKLVAGVCHDAKLRRLVRNMIYDGVLSALLGIDLGQMERALRKQLGRKPKAVELNLGALHVGYEFAKANLEKRDPFYIEPMDATRGKILIEGNAACALGAMMAGAAGVLYGLMFTQVFFFTGFIPGLKAFTAAVLGGIGNVPGAMLGGLFLGLTESIGPILFLSGLQVPSPNQLKDVIAFTMLVLILIFRPSGILGERLAAKRA